MLEARVEAGESGPVIMLAGEADMTGAGQIDALITGQLAAETWQLTLDLSELRFADAASIRPLALAAGTLQQPEIGALREAERKPEPGRTRRARDEYGTG